MKENQFFRPKSSTQSPQPEVFRPKSSATTMSETLAKVGTQVARYQLRPFFPRTIVLSQFFDHLVTEHPEINGS